jgi:hypothetical protein
MAAPGVFLPQALKLRLRALNKIQGFGLRLVVKLQPTPMVDSIPEAESFPALRDSRGTPVLGGR